MGRVSIPSVARVLNAHQPLNHMSQVQRVLNSLKDFRPHTVIELNGLVYKLNKPTSARLAARVWELRQRGYQIASNKTEKNSKIWWYQLLKTPENKTLLKNK